MKVLNKDRWNDEGHLFTSWDGHAIGHNTPSRWFKDFLTDLRERQMVEQIKAGAPRKVLSSSR
jgi:hypothetical protein